MEAFRDILVNNLPEFVSPEDLLTLINSSGEVFNLYRGKWQILLHHYFPNSENLNLSSWPENLKKELFQLLALARSTLQLFLQAMHKDSKIFYAVVDILEEKDVKSEDRILIVMYLDSEHLEEYLDYFEDKFPLERGFRVREKVFSHMKEDFKKENLKLVDYSIKFNHPKYEADYSSRFYPQLSISSYNGVGEPIYSLTDLLYDIQKYHQEYAMRNDIHLDPVSDTIDLFAFCRALYDLKYKPKDYQALLDELRKNGRDIEVYIIETYMSL